MAYNDLKTAVNGTFTTQASAASSDLAGIVAGADVLATQFDSLKSTVDSLSIALNELTGGQYTVLKDTAAARPATPSTGQLFFASDTKALSLYGGSWGLVSPTGIVSPFAGASAPEGWLLCDGSAVSQTTYAALFAVVGANAFGTDGGGNFSLPNLKGRTVIGVGVGTEITGVRGTLQGAASVTLTGAQSGTSAHSHPTGTTSGSDWNAVYNHYSASSGSAAYPVSTSEGGGRTIQGAGGNHTHTYTVPTATAANAVDSHTNIQPSLPLNYIIKY